MKTAFKSIGAGALLGIAYMLVVCLFSGCLTYRAPLYQTPAQRQINAAAIQKALVQARAAIAAQQQNPPPQ